ncbi:MAG: AAA family ATPase [Lachnospiraceae bacterium]|nr:AAA family ATPase [Lachnospiraceae bacterium]
MALHFVDKSALLKELIPIVEQPDSSVTKQGINKGKGQKYICITRPRRFGKTVMANMIASFFGKGHDSRSIFEKMTIGKYEHFEKHRNQHHVISIAFNEMPRDCQSYRQYIDRIQNRLIQDLKRMFPKAEIADDDAVWDAINNVFELEDSIKFIFVLDEWDYIFHRKFVTEIEKEEFVDFLSGLLKDQPYVELAYMTGILPIAKYSSGSELNMFCEYTMAAEEKFSEYFGFTETEVDQLYAVYKKSHPTGKVTREGLRIWYDGYYTRSGERVYNPRSVVLSLTNDNLGNYWTSAGPYDEIFYYIRNNVAAVRDDLALMVSGIPVRSKVREYAATSMKLTTKDEIFSAMVVYDFLSYENGYVSIPNKELADCIILELKVNHTAQEAIQQIKEKK